MDYSHFFYIYFIALWLLMPVVSYNFSQKKLSFPREKKKLQNVLFAQIGQAAGTRKKTKGFLKNSFSFFQKPFSFLIALYIIYIMCSFYSSRSPSNTSCQGSPCLLSCSMNGSGSNSSTFHTPGRCHNPLKNIMAPIIAGTPVV